MATGFVTSLKHLLPKHTYKKEGMKCIHKYQTPFYSNNSIVETNNNQMGAKT